MILRTVWLKRRSMVFSWLLSYLSIMLIPIIISGIVYFKSREVLVNEITQAGDFILKQIQQNMDKKLQDVERLGLEISLNPRLQKLMYVKGQLDKAEGFNIYNIVNDMKALKASNMFVDEFYIYFRNADAVVTSSTMRDSKTLYDILHKNKEMKYKSWLELVQGKHMGDLVPMTAVKNSGDVYKVAAYMRSLPIENVNDSRATLVMLIDENNLLESIRDIPWTNDGVVFILDNNNRVIVSDGSFNLPKSLRYETLDKSGVIYEKLNGEDVVVSYITSNAAKWKYITIIPTKVFWEKAEYIRKLTYISLTFCLLLGGIATYLFLRKNYNPLRNIIRSIAYNVGVSFDDRCNEYRFIQEIVANTIDEKEKINRKLEQQNLEMRSSFLVRLLKGRFDDKVSVDQVLKQYDINFRSEYFAVMLFYIKDFSNLYTEEDNLSTSEKFKLVRFIISNVIEELVNKNNYGVMAEMDELMACIINFEEDGVDIARQELLRITKETQLFLQDNFSIYLTVSISSVNKTITGISQACEEAFEAMEYKMIMGNNRIIFYDDIKNNKIEKSRYKYYYPLLIEQQLINCIKTGNLEDSENLLMEILDRNFSGQRISIQMSKCLMLDLAGTIAKAMNEIDNACDDLFLENLEPVEQLIGCETVDEMKNRMTGILRNICEYIKDNKCERYHLIDEIVEFIDNNYFDMDLNISMIGQQFNMSPSYLSRLFKEKIGEGLLDYINKVRINRAKELLKEQRIKVSEIAKRVGYNDSNVFIRIFKKYEGVTPGKYY